MLAADEGEGPVIERRQSGRALAGDPQGFYQALAEMSALVGESLDYGEALSRVAEAAVPRLGDWCVLHVPRPDGLLEPVAVAHAEPGRVRWARELQERYPARVDDQSGPARVLRTGRSEVYPE